MTAHSGEPRKSPTLTTLTELVRSSAPSPSPLQLRRGLRTVTSRLSAERSRRGALSRLSLAAIVTAVCLAGIVGFVLARAGRPQPSSPALAYRVEGGTVIEGGYLRESGRDGITITFSEGTELTLMPGAHGRLRSVDGAGAHVAIDSGTASFRVTPRDGARWLVDVGPFVVTVKGTVFTVSWDVARERFEVRLQEGRVTVSGPVSGGDIVLRSGQRLVVDLPRSETLITEEKPGEAAQERPQGGLVDAGAGVLQEPSAAPPTGRPSAEPSDSAREVESAPPSGTGSTARSRWAEAVAAADWGRILRDAEDAGIPSTLNRASSDDLMALADAARYRRRMDVAREALLAQRRRFPSSTRSLDAAYLLGRVEESSPSGIPGALRWYDEYLARAPRGTYASEALGRKMILTSKLNGSSQARPLAEQYIRRFPNGAYAGSARALLQAR